MHSSEALTAPASTGLSVHGPRRWALRERSTSRETHRRAPTTSNRAVRRAPARCRRSKCVNHPEGGKCPCEACRLHSARELRKISAAIQGRHDRRGKSSAGTGTAAAGNRGGAPRDDTLRAEVIATPASLECGRTGRLAGARGRIVEIGPVAFYFLLMIRRSPSRTSVIGMQRAAPPSGSTKMPQSIS